MAMVSLALVWHHHQPYYPDDVAGENPMPWVRLHATKDYLGMALHLEEVPEFACTINLVPSLLVQLEAYVNGATDTHLIHSRKPVDGLNDEAACYVLDNFFMASPDSMIRPHHRYHELYMMRSAWNTPAKHALGRFRPRDLRDLQVWSNLAWFHPLLFETDHELAEFREKGRYYTEDEKHWLLDKQRELLAEVIPRHRKLAERGQIELTTSPFFHPILPLLLDKNSAREAMPDVALPGYRGGYADDAAAHVRRAVESHTRHFGERPRGMWPSEGSVSQALIPLLASHGIEWIATDEEILGCSTGGRIGRDSRGHVRHPELLYRAWKVREADHELAIIFRDHSMSDQIGFHYQRSPGPVAAADFLAKLHAIGDACRHNPATLVSVILDGENCWEYYPDGGVSFLRSVYQGVARDPRVRPVKIGEFLRQHPACRHGAAALCGELDQPQLRHLDRPSRRQPRLGRSARGPRVPGGRGEEPAARSGGAGPGLERDLHRPGLRLVLVVRRRPFFGPRRAVRSSVPQAPAKRVHSPGLRSARRLVHADLTGGCTPAAARPAGQLLESQDRRPRHLFRVDRRRALSSAATIAGR